MQYCFFASNLNNKKTKFISNESDILEEVSNRDFCKLKIKKLNVLKFMIISIQKRKI